MANEMNRRTGRIGNGNLSVGSRNPSVLNPSMSRGGFVKTAGVGMVGAGAMAAGFGGVARAQSGPIVIYPTGDPMQDTDIIQNAINNASDGDVILLKACKIGETTVTPWYLKKPLTTETVWITGTNGDPVAYWDPSYAGVGMPVVIEEKKLTLKGEVDSNGAPLTLLKGADNQASWLERLTSAYTNGYLTDFCSGAILATGSKKVRIESLQLKYFNPLSPIVMGFGPTELVNCKFSFFDNGVELERDNGYPQGGPQLVSNCVFSDYVGYFALITGGSSLAGEDIVQNCEFYGTSFDFDLTGPLTCIWGQAVSLESPDFPPLAIPTLKNLTIKNCTFDFTDSHHQLGGFAVSAANAYGGLVENVSVRNCEFINIIKPGWGYVLEVAFPYNGDGHGHSTAPGTATNCSAVDNTFTNCSGDWGIVLLDGYSNSRGTGKPINCLVSNNTYMNCGSFAEYFTLTDSCQSLNNDYTRSHLGGWNKSPNQSGCVIIDTSTSDTVREYLFPPGTTVCNQVLDFGENTQVLDRNGQPVQCNFPSIVNPYLQDMLVAIKERHSRKMQMLGNQLFDRLGRRPGRFGK